jgi:hypothetical protein
VKVYSAQDCTAKEDKGLSSIPVLLKAGLSLKTQWAFIKLGIPGGLMMSAEASSYDVSTAFAGLLGVALDLMSAQGAQTLNHLLTLLKQLLHCKTHTHTRNQV